MSRPTLHDWPEDETLVAYADGKLDAETAAAVEKHLEVDADARQFVLALQRSAQLAQNAFDEALTAPLPAKLQDAILARSDADVTARAGTADVVRFPQRPKLPGAYAVPLAACIALLIGGIGGFQLSERMQQPSPSADVVAVGVVPDNSVVLKALQTLASNEPVALGKSGTATSELMVVATFHDAAGRICRELEVTEAGEPSSAITAAVACRQADGRWLIEGAVRMAEAPKAPDHDFAPAKGDKTSAIEGVLTAIGAKGALSKDDERQLLKNGWK